MSVSFDPLHLLPEASLNRTVLPAVPGVRAEMVSRTALELLGAHALARVDADASGVGFVGERVAALLAALTFGSPATGLGLEPTPWRQAYLAHWRTIRTVALGGGMTQRFGPRIAEAANSSLRDAGLDAPMVWVPEHASSLPLIGVARSIRGCRSLLVLDLGHTSVKRGLARYDGSGRLTSIELLPPIPVDQQQNPPEEVTAFVRDVVQASLADAGEATKVAASVAAYVPADGEIGDRRSYYQQLVTGGSRQLADLVARTVGGESELLLVHDGTAAARAVASTTPAAVITLGTTLGAGFAPGPTVLVPLAPEFTVIS